MDSTELANLQAVDRLVDAWNAGDLQSLASLWAPGMVHHGREVIPMPAGVTATEMQRFLTAFPDLKMELQSAVAQGDMVCTRIQLSATHQGPYLGAPASGHAISCRLMGQLRFQDGRVVEHWGVADGIAVLVAIGLCPEDYLQVTA